MKLSKTSSYCALVFGVLTAFTGAALVFMYMLEAVVARVGEPDQSLLFWYLPVLYLGLIGMVIGSGVVVWGVIRLRKARLQIPPGEAQLGDAADPRGEDKR